MTAYVFLFVAALGAALSAAAWSIERSGKPGRVTTRVEGHDHDVCPACDAELCGGLIRETIKQPSSGRGPWTEQEIVSSYGDHLCYSATIGIEYPERYDGVSVWLYPCCGARRDRFTGEPVV